MIIFIYTLLSFIIGFSIMYFRHRKIIKNLHSLLSKGTGRMGIFTESSCGIALSHIEFEEIATAGNMVKFIITDISFTSNAGSVDRDKISKSFKIGQINWGDERKITWFDDNTQRIRDNRLKEILDDSK